MTQNEQYDEAILLSVVPCSPSQHPPIRTLEGWGGKVTKSDFKGPLPPTPFPSSHVDGSVVYLVELGP